jgi:aspartate kinase
MKFQDCLSLGKEIFKIHFNAASKLNLGSETFDYISLKEAEIYEILKAFRIYSEITPRLETRFLSLGELLSSRILFDTIRKDIASIGYFEAVRAIITDSEYKEANVNFRQTDGCIKEICGELFRKNNIVITQGFIASDGSGNTTILGRGGSDYSAAIFASALNAKKLEIWTDVDGVMTSDPRYIKDARLITNLSYSEASELAYFGASVLHPKTIFPAIKKKIPVIVLNSFNTRSPGTLISEKGTKKKILKAIAFRKDITIINILSNRMLGAFGFLSKVFKIFEEYKTSVDLVTTSEVSISLTIDNDKNLVQILAELKKFSEVSTESNLAIISAVGKGIRDTAGIAARFFGVLRGINIKMVSIGASEVNLSIIVNEKDLINAVSLLHNEFFSDNKFSDVFVKLN